MTSVLIMSMDGCKKLCKNTSNTNGSLHNFKGRLISINTLPLRRVFLQLIEASLQSSSAKYQQNALLIVVSLNGLCTFIPRVYENIHILFKSDVDSSNVLI